MKTPETAAWEAAWVAAGAAWEVVWAAEADLLVARKAAMIAANAAWEAAEAARAAAEKQELLRRGEVK